jgi:drug/metabolite transporter (DMT)-like permease
MVAAVRYLSPHYSAFEIVFFRSVIGLALQAPWAIGGGWRTVLDARWRLVMVRSLFNFAGSAVWFIALSMMAISDAMALQFTLPLFAVTGAWLFLRERVGARRWIGVAVGFMGAMVIIRPGFAEVPPAAAIALTAAALYAAVHLTTKKLAGALTGNALIFHANIVAIPLSLVLAVPDWVTPAPAHWPALIAVGLFGTVAHVFMERAYRAADASFIAPTDFSKLLFTALYGWVLFGETSDAWTWIGAAIIVAGTTFTTRHEIRAASGAAPGRPP